MCIRDRVEVAGIEPVGRFRGVLSRGADLRERSGRLRYRWSRSPGGVDGVNDDLGEAAPEREVMPMAATGDLWMSRPGALTCRARVHPILVWFWYEHTDRRPSAG